MRYWGSKSTLFLALSSSANFEIGWRWGGSYCGRDRNVERFTEYAMCLNFGFRMNAAYVKFD